MSNEWTSQNPRTEGGGVSTQTFTVKKDGEMNKKEMVRQSKLRSLSLSVLSTGTC